MCFIAHRCINGTDKDTACVTAKLVQVNVANNPVMINTLQRVFPLLWNNPTFTLI